MSNSTDSTNIQILPQQYNESICQECGKSFKSASGLKHHLFTHAKDARKYECYICKKAQYKNKYLLKSHFYHYHNPKRPTRVICHICSASVFSFHLKTHIREKHTEKGMEKVQCEICSHWIVKRGMKAHMGKHTDMGVTCKLCGKFLKNKGSMYSHMQIRHGVGERKFKCTLCDKGR
jgi:Zinc finger, C2H2 type